MGRRRLSDAARRRESGVEAGWIDDELRSTFTPHPEEPRAARRLEGWPRSPRRMVRDAQLRCAPHHEGFSGRSRSPIAIRYSPARGRHVMTETAALRNFTINFGP